MTDRWLVSWGLGSIAFGGASLVVPLYVVQLGGGPFELGILAAAAAFVGVPGALVVGRLADRTGQRRVYVLSALALVAVSSFAIPTFERIGPVVVVNAVIWLAFAAATPALTLLAVTGADEGDWSERIGRLNQFQGWGWAAGLLLGAVWTGLGGFRYEPLVVQRSLLVVIGACAAGAFLAGIRTLPADPDRHGPDLLDGVRRAVRRADRFGLRSGTFPFVPVRFGLVGLHPRLFVRRFTPSLSVYYGAVGLFFAGFAVFLAPLPAFLSDTGFDSDGVFALYLVISIASAVFFGWAGRLSAGRDASVLQATSLVCRGGILPVVALAGAALGASIVGFGVVAVVFAVFGAAWSLIAVTAGTLVTRLAPVGIRGEALGVYGAFGALAAGFGSILGGWLAARGYLVAFLTAAVLVFAGAALVFTLRGRTTR